MDVNFKVFIALVLGVFGSVALAQMGLVGCVYVYGVCIYALFMYVLLVGVFRASDKIRERLRRRKREKEELERLYDHGWRLLMQEFNSEGNKEY